MKKAAVKKILAFVVIVWIVLTTIGLLLHYSKPEPSMPSFNFLKGRKLTYHKVNKSRTQYNTIQDFYSFEADFDDVFPDANKELLALGFVDKTRPDPGDWTRHYLLRKGPYKRIHLTIYRRQKLGIYSTPKSSDYSSPDRHEFHIQYGWVSVSVSVETVPWRIRFYSRLYGIINRLRP